MLERKPFYTLADLPALIKERAIRQIRNKYHEIPDNSKLYAGASMTFLCTDCNEYIYAQEEYVNRNHQCDGCLWIRFLETRKG